MQPVIFSVVKGISERGVIYGLISYIRIYWWKFLVPVHPLNNIEITDYFNYELRFNGAFSRNNIPRIKAYGSSVYHKSWW